MYYWRLLVLAGMLAMLVLGCSRKKEQAAKLEQEMMQGETTAVDTSAVSPAESPETEATETTPAQEMDATAIPAEEETAITPQTEEAAGYVLQLAACESLDYAQYLVEKFTKRGYSPYLTTATVNGQTYYRVRIGGFETLEEAKQLQAELADKYSIKGWIDIAE